MSIQFGTRAADGALEIAITAVETTVTIDGTPVRVRSYNGELPGPTFYVRAGERVRLVFTNQMSEATNLHLHGMHMPPEVDDPHRVAQPGDTLVYEFDIPADGAGTYWYHPHVHGEVARQLGEGLAGAFVVLGPTDRALPLASAQEHVLVLQDVALDDGGIRLRTPMEMHDGREGELVLVNGQVTPTYSVAGGLVRVRVINGCSARFFDLALEGAEVYQIGIDASLLGEPVRVDQVLVPPGQRVDLLVRATERGRFVLRHRVYERGTFRLPWQKRRLPNDGVLATFDVTTAGVAELPVLPALERLDPATAVTTRIFEYGGKGQLAMLFALLLRRRYGAGDGSKGPVRFWLNGREFEAGRIDTEVELGTTEIWELRNPTLMDHPFHLHIYPFQVLDIDGKPPAFPAWQDVINVPRGSTVRIVVPFRDFAGVTMFHCHILEHEDNGMMAHLRVVDPARPEAAAACAHAHGA